MQAAKILYFINGPVPTEEQVDEAAKMAANVSFRNAEVFDENTKLEECDGVAGDAIPEVYSDAFPGAAEAIADFKNEKQGKKAAKGKMQAKAGPTPLAAQQGAPGAAESTPAGAVKTAAAAAGKPANWQAGR